MSIKFIRDGSISFFENGYGEMGIMIKGPRGGEKGDFLLSKQEVIQLKGFITSWLTTSDVPEVKEAPEVDPAQELHRQEEKTSEFAHCRGAMVRGNETP